MLTSQKPHNDPSLHQIILQDDAQALKDWLDQHPMRQPDRANYDGSMLGTNVMYMALNAEAFNCMTVFWEDDKSSLASLMWSTRMVLNQIMKEAQKTPSSTEVYQKKIDHLITSIPNNVHTKEMLLSLAFYAPSCFLPDFLCHPKMSKHHVREVWMLWLEVYDQGQHQSRSMFEAMLDDLTPQEVFKGLKSIEDESELRSPLQHATFLNSDKCPEKLLSHLLSRDHTFWSELDALIQQDPTLSTHLPTLWPSYDNRLLRQDLQDRLLKNKPSSPTRLL